MKNVFVVFLVLIAIKSWSQSFYWESDIFSDSNKLEVRTQRIELSTDNFTLKYDYKAEDKDVLGFIMPNIISDSSLSFSGALFKIGDQADDNQFAVDFWLNKSFGRFSSKIELGRIIDQNISPVDFAGTRLSYGNFTAETYILKSKYAEKDNQFYSWISYHPDKAYLSLGLDRDKYWFFLGTKDWNNFGNLSFGNYNPESGDFWVRSQSGFGQIDQKFFSQDLYLFATSYLVVPAFFFQHFSPISTKGSQSFKIDVRRITDIYYTEIIAGKQLGKINLAAGINSRYDQGIFSWAPSLEAYKSFQFGDLKVVTELRYDFLNKSFSAYITTKY